MFFRSIEVIKLSNENLNKFVEKKLQQVSQFDFKVDIFQVIANFSVT